jgi:enolase
MHIFFSTWRYLGGGAYARPGTQIYKNSLSYWARNIRVAPEMNFELHKELRKVIESIDKHFTIGRGDEVYRLRM